MFWKNDRNIIVALEVGSTKIACAIGEVRNDGSLALLGVGESPSGQVRKCEIVDFETAQRCVYDALNDAERKTDVIVNEVYLSISGAHMHSKNVRHSVVINDSDDEVTEDHLEELRSLAQNHTLPSDFSLVHDLLQHYVLDDDSITDNPLGLASKRLSADYHIVYGLSTRLLTTIRCVKELSIDVKNYALNSYATAQAVLTKSQKMAGAVVINLGGGITDWICYDKGAVVHSGVIGVGGDHVTNDIVAGLKIPYAKAEELKKSDGSCILKESEKDDVITMPGAYNFEERRIYRESLVTIMQARMEETLEIVQADLRQQAFWEDFAGTIYLTGGASQVQGLLTLARGIFPHHIELAHQFPFDGDQNYANRPDLSTVLGLLRYARRAELETPPARGFARMRESFKRALAGMRLF
ncbi:MAG: cell division protein FtsA [Pseudomonadota bacterium]